MRRAASPTALDAKAERATKAQIGFDTAGRVTAVWEQPADGSANDSVYRTRFE